MVDKILNAHRLLKIIKLPEKTFDEGTTTSIFIFESGVPQNDEEIFTCYIKEDGLERVKNQGRRHYRNYIRSNTGSKDFPRSERLYSTRGGISP